MFYTSVKWDLSSTLIGIFGAYTLTSFVLFKYPTLLHKKKHVAFLARHISHRGGGYGFKINSQYSFVFKNNGGNNIAQLPKVQVPRFYEIINARSIFVSITGAGEGYENTMMAFRRLIKNFAVLNLSSNLIHFFHLKI